MSAVRETPQKRYRDRKRDSGTRYITVPLTPAADRALRRLMARFGSQTAAVNFAIVTQDAALADRATIERCVIVEPE